LLDRASLTITHAGLNTALESLAHGLPMVAIPITNDQPGVASRLVHVGVAEMVLPHKLTARRLRTALEKVLRESRYRENARRHSDEIAKRNGLRHAADIAEQALTTRQTVLRT
jgi:UDP:flavonoid glycosyltransferase YjiC (YdhE family)